MSTIKRNVKLSPTATNALKKSMLLPALGVVTLIVSQIGCSIHICKDRDCPYRMGQNRTHQAAVHQYSNQTTSSPDIANTKSEPANPATAATIYSYQDGVKVGREYARRFGITQPIALTEQLPNELRDSNFGSVFESGCRNGINSLVREQQISAQPRPAKKVVASPIKAVKKVPGKTTRTERSITETAKPKIQNIAMPTQPAARPRNDEGVAVPDTNLPGRDVSIVDNGELFVETPEQPDSQPNEADSIDSSPEFTAPEMEVTESNEGLVTAPDVERLFEESRTLRTIEPEVQWQEISPEQNEISQAHVANELAPAIDPSTELEPAIDPLDEPMVFEPESSVTEMSGLLNPQPATVPNIDNSLRPKTEIVTSEPQPQPATPQPITTPQPISTPLVSTPVESTREIKLSATYVPFRRQSAAEPLIESDASVLNSENRNVTGQDGQVRLRAVPAYQINNRVPRFRPANASVKTTQAASPKPFVPGKTAVPARSIGSSVLVDNLMVDNLVVDNLEWQGIELNREPTLTATPFTQLNRDLNQIPISTSRATWQGPGAKPGKIQNESSKNYFVPTDLNSIPLFSPRKEDMIDSPILTSPNIDEQPGNRQAGPENSDVYR